MEDQTKSFLDALALEEQKLQLQLAENQRQQRKINADEWHLKYGINIGDNFKFTDFKGFIEAKLVSLRYSENKVYCGQYTPYKADGFLGKQVFDIHAPKLETIKKI